MQTYVAYQGQMALLKSSRINSINGHSVTFVKQKTIETQTLRPKFKRKGKHFQMLRTIQANKH